MDPRQKNLSVVAFVFAGIINDILDSGGGTHNQTPIVGLNEFDFFPLLTSKSNLHD